MLKERSTKEDLQSLIESARNAADCLKALSHETRLLIICYINDREKSVQELEELLGATQSSISQHLAKLRDKGILDYRKEGNQVFYRIKNPDILKIIETLCNVYG